MSRIIKRVAVIGSGTMGGAIAAHFANAGYFVDLLDIAPDKLTPDEERKGLKLESPAVRNRVVNGGWDRVKKARPSALFSAELTERVRLGNLADNFDRLADADWILEAIVEILDLKRNLMERIDAIRKPATIVSTNTSGIPIHSIAEGRSEDFKRHFLGTHFFNPPRYLKLLEVIPIPDTDPEVVEFVSQFGADVLGKTVVICKDTPNFIANRLGVFIGNYRLAYTLENGYTVEEVDYLTGPLIGTPKTATFRLSDLVGLDVMAHVSRNLYDLVPDDESRDLFKNPSVVETMLQKGMLGNKTSQGYYKEVRQNGKKDYWVLDLDSMEYKPPTKVAMPEIEKVKKVQPLGERLKAVVGQPGERGSDYVWNTTAQYMAYSSRRIPEIADDLASVDTAMKAGYGVESGPFETWDMLGVPQTVERMNAEGIQVAPWVRDMLAKGYTSFYKTENGQQMVYSPLTCEYVPIVTDKRQVSLAGLKSQGKELKRNDSASVIDLGDGILCVEFHSRANALDDMIGQMMAFALDELEKPQWNGLVIGNQGEWFGAGANIAIVAMNAMAKQWPVLDKMIRDLQGIHQRMRFSPKPVVAAPFNMTLGGGAEVALASSRIAASAETYMGLVEVGVGLIPAGGGCKEMVRRVLSPAMKTPHVDPLPFLERIFLQVGTAKVSTSAVEARNMGMLDDADIVVMNPEFLVGEAKQFALDLAETYQPPVNDKNVYAAGKPVLAALELGIWSMLQAKQISEYDAKIGRKLAYVLTGGSLSQGQWLDEQHFLDLEREAFLSLLGEQKTLDRISHMLQTGKPLRN